MLAEKVEKAGAKVYLVNTGWNGTGQRMKLRYTRAMVTAALTGYSMAAGGPIVEPTARNLLLTPICPHSTRSSSYVLSPEHVITVEAPDANRKFVYLSVDGGKAFSLKNNDQVRVSTSKYTTKLVRLSKKSFCEILDKKMGGEVTKA